MDSTLARTSTTAKRTTQDTDRLAKSSRSLGSHLRTVAGAAAGAAAAYIGIAQAKAAVETTTDLAKTTLTLNKNLGLTVRTASEFAAVAKARGVEGKQLAQSFGILAKNVEAAKLGTESAVKPFKDLGVTQRELRKLNPNQLILELSDGMNKLGPGTQRTAASMKLFGRGWQTIVPLFRDGSKEMQSQLDLANKYGASFGGKAVNSIFDLVKAQRELKLAQFGLQIQFTEHIAPALIKVGLAIANFIHQLETGKGAGGKFIAVMRVVGKVLEILYLIVRRAVLIIAGMVNIVRKLVGVWSSLPGPIRFAGKVMAALIGGPLLLLTLGIKAAIKIVKTFGGVFQGAASTGLSAFRRLGKGVSKIAAGIGSAIATAAEVIRSVVKFIVRAVNKAVSALGSLKDKIPTIDLPSISVPNPLDALPFQRGGKIVPGTGSGDKVRALLEPGEVVINRKAVRAMGGPRKVNAINQVVPRFAQGGTVGPISIGGSGALQQMTQGATNTMVGAANRYIGRHRSKGGLLGGNVPVGPIQKMAKAMVRQIFGGGQWGAFNALEMAEAGWNPRALNASSGAAGLAQALPASKYPPGAWPYKGPKSAKLQLQWMMQYIKERYGSPKAAWSFHQGHNWYQRGGIVEPLRLAQGGYVQGAQKPHGAAGKGIRHFAAQMFKRGFSATSGGEYRGTGTYHDQQQAIDWGSSVNNMGRLWKLVFPVKSKMLELLGPPGLYDNGVKFSDAALQAQHMDHIHTAVGPGTSFNFGGGGGGGAAAAAAGAAPKPKLHMTKKQRKALERLAKKLKKMGLDPRTQGTINALTADYQRFDEYAGYAGETEGPFRGASEADWLTKELGTLFRLRNLLIRAFETIAAHREKVAKMLANAHKSLDALNKVKKPTRAQRQQKMKLREQIGMLTGEQGKLNKQLGSIVGPDGTLVEIQGTGGPMKAMAALTPAAAVQSMGGQIFTVAKSLLDLGSNSSVTDSGAGSEQADLLRELLRNMTQRFNISEAALGVFSNYPPFGGTFHSGGVVPGPIGAERMILAQGGETITPAGAAEVHLHFAPGTEWLRDYVRVEVGKQARRMGRGGNRPLPSRGGGM